MSCGEVGEYMLGQDTSGYESMTPVAMPRPMVAVERTARRAVES